jgi:hypothetical protein
MLLKTVVRGRAAANLVFISDLEDPKFGTTVLPGADFNVENGGCIKAQVQKI